MNKVRIKSKTGKRMGEKLTELMKQNLKAYDKVITQWYLLVQYKLGGISSYLCYGCTG